MAYLYPHRQAVTQVAGVPRRCRVGDDRVTSLAGSAYQGRVAEAIDALRASAPISGDGGNTGRFQAGEHQATTGLSGLVEGNASGHSGNGVILADLRGGLPRSQAFPRLIVFKAQYPVTMGMELFSPIGRVRRRRSRPRLRQCV